MEMDPWIAEAVDSFLSSGRMSLRRRPLLPRSHVKSTESEMGDSYSNLEELKEKLRTRQDEIFKLQAANSDLTQVNKRWHRYNSDMQMFIEKLQSTIRDQQEQINRMGEESTFPKEKAVGGECRRKECTEAKEEVTKLKEKVKHLEFQVKSHKEDWEAERTEKEAVVRSREELERRFAQALRQMLPIRKPRDEETAHCPVCRSYSLNSTSANTASNYTNTLYACNNGGCRRRDFGLTAYGRLVCDSSGNQDAACSSPSSEPGDPTTPTVSLGIKSSSQLILPVVKSSSAPERRCFVQTQTEEEDEEEDIACPSCHKVFSSRVHMEFLDHFEVCTQGRSSPD